MKTLLILSGIALFVGGICAAGSDLSYRVSLLMVFFGACALVWSDEIR